MSISRTTPPTSLGINFDPRYGFVAPLFAPSFPLLRGYTGKRLQSLVYTSPQLAIRHFRGRAALPTHAVRPLRRTDVHGFRSFARFVAVSISTSVNGVLSRYASSSADKQSQHHSSQHRDTPLFNTVSFAEVLSPPF